MGIEVHTDHSEFRMDFKIEQEPDGTFVGRCEQPKLEIRGATREEVLQKIQQSLGSRILEKIGMEASAALEGSGIHVKVNKRMTVTKVHPDGTRSEIFSSGSSSPSGADGTPMLPKPIDTGSFLSQELITAFLVLAAIGLLVWWFFLHK